MRATVLLLGQKLIERGAWFLAPLSWIWAVAVFIKNLAYDHKWIVQRRVPCPVVSVGNLIAGGTGKTPLVQMIASSFASRKIAIVSRFQDEALLLCRRLPHAAIYSGKNKADLAEQAAREGAELIIVDDGFQHRKLYRDFDIVLLRGDENHYLPWGFLRDSPKRLQKADAVFLGGRDFQHATVRVLDEKEQELPSVAGWRAGLFCGIGNPRAFKKTVSDLGVEVVAEWILADHEIASPARLESFASNCKALGAKVLITTEKDFIKEPRCSLPIVFIEIEIKWLQGKEKWEKLIAEIDQKIDNRSTYDRTDKN